MKIQDYRTNLEREFISNNALLDKMKGIPIYYNQSIFQLFHIKTFKFLSLCYDNSQTLRYLFYLLVLSRFSFFRLELIDNPNQASNFKFIPSLKLNSKVNGQVYDEDNIEICSANLISYRIPKLYIDYCKL